MKDFINRLRFLAYVFFIFLTVFIGNADAVNNNKSQRLQKTVISYLVQPEFASFDFLKQISGVNANFERYNEAEDMLYFSVKVNEFNEKRDLKAVFASQIVEI